MSGYKWLLEAYELLDDAKWSLDAVRDAYEHELSGDLCGRIEGLISDICDVQEQLCAEAKMSQDEVAKLVATKEIVRRKCDG